MPRANQGRSKSWNHSAGDCVNGVYPRAGSHSNFTANTMTSNMASQKSGMATAMLEPTVTPRSRAVPWCSPATMPDGTPSRMATTMPPAATLRVTGKRTAMPEATVSLLKRELPRFPCSAALSQFQY